jgi:glycerol-3-phosphate dehydrogenase
VAALARRLEVKMPITFALDRVLNHGAPLGATIDQWLKGDPS